MQDICSGCLILTIDYIVILRLIWQIVTLQNQIIDLILVNINQRRAVLV